MELNKNNILMPQTFIAFLDIYIIMTYNMTFESNLRKNINLLDLTDKYVSHWAPTEDYFTLFLLYQ